MKLTLKPEGVAGFLRGKIVDFYDFPDGRLEVRWKGRWLPYSSFDKLQRVSYPLSSRTSVSERFWPGSRNSKTASPASIEFRMDHDDQAPLRCGSLRGAGDYRFSEGRHDQPARRFSSRKAQVHDTPTDPRNCQMTWHDQPVTKLSKLNSNFF